MARKPRTYSESGFYHVILRGINRDKIFKYKLNKNYFVNILDRNFVKESEYRNDKRKGCIYAFCILDNHIHMLIKESPLGISNLMQRVAGAYANFYNKRCGRSGPVFESRFTSKAVESKKYFTEVVKYIHNNPVKAKITDSPRKYEWSSAQYYFNNELRFLNTEFIRKNMSDQEFNKFMNSPVDECEQIMNCKWPERISDFDVIAIIKSIYPGYKRDSMLNNLSDKILINIMDKLMRIKGIAKAQIARILGVRTYQINKLIAHLHL